MRGWALYLAFGTASLALGTAAPARAFCPCYTLSSASNDHDCGIEAVPGQNPSPAEWNQIFDLVSRGPAAWGESLAEHLTTAGLLKPAGFHRELFEFR